MRQMRVVCYFSGPGKGAKHANEHENHLIAEVIHRNYKEKDSGCTFYHKTLGT